MRCRRFAPWTLHEGFLLAEPRQLGRELRGGLLRRGRRRVPRLATEGAKLEPPLFIPLLSFEPDGELITQQQQQKCHDFKSTAQVTWGRAPSQRPRHLAAFLLCCCRSHENLNVPARRPAKKERLLLTRHNIRLSPTWIRGTSHCVQNSEGFF